MAYESAHNVLRGVALLERLCSEEHNSIDRRACRPVFGACGRRLGAAGSSGAGRSGDSSVRRSAATRLSLSITEERRQALDAFQLASRGARSASSSGSKPRCRGLQQHHQLHANNCRRRSSRLCVSVRTPIGRCCVLLRRLPKTTLLINTVVTAAARRCTSVTRTAPTLRSNHTRRRSADAPTVPRL
jgi:hypothetical protein